MSIRLFSTRSRRFAHAASGVVVGLLLTACGVTEMATDSIPRTTPHTGWQLSVQNVANSSTLIAGFSIGYDVYYAGVSADYSSIQVVHQNPDWTLDSQPSLSLKTRNGFAIVPGTVQVSDQFTDPSGTVQVAVTAVSGSKVGKPGDHAVTWNVSYDSNDGSLAQTGYSDWVGPPSSGSQVVSMAAFPSTVPQNGLYYPARIGIKWSNYTPGEDCFTIYTWPTGGNPRAEEIFCGRDSPGQTTKIGVTRLKIPNSSGGTAPEVAFTYVNGKEMQATWWDASDNRVEVGIGDANNTMAVLVAPFQNVGDSKPDVTLITKPGGGNKYQATFYQFSYDTEKQAVVLVRASIPANPISLPGLASATDVSFGLVGYQPPSSARPTASPSATSGLPGYATTSMFLSSQLDSARNPSLIGIDLSGDSLPAVDYPSSLANPNRALPGSTSVGNYLGGFAAIAGVTSNGQLALYGYNANVGGFDLSQQTGGGSATPTPIFAPPMN